jgi:hypothetical protein
MMQQQQQQQQPNAAHPENGDGELEPDVEGNAMLEGVILPAFEHVSLFGCICVYMADQIGWISNT